MEKALRKMKCMKPLGKDPPQMTTIERSSQTYIAHVEKNTGIEKFKPYIIVI